MASTIATVLALAVAIESTLGLPTAVAAVLPVAVAAATVVCIFQVVIVWSSPSSRSSCHFRSSSRSSRCRDLPSAAAGRQDRPGVRAFVGRGAGRDRARVPGCMDPAAWTPLHGPCCATIPLSLGRPAARTLSLGPLVARTPRRSDSSSRAVSRVHVQRARSGIACAGGIPQTSAALHSHVYTV